MGGGGRRIDVRPFFVLPTQRSEIVDDRRRWTREWYLWLQKLTAMVGDGQTTLPDVSALASQSIGTASPAGLQRAQQTADAATLLAASGLSAFRAALDGAKQSADAAYRLAVLRQPRDTTQQVDAAFALAVALRQPRDPVDGGQLPATATNDNATVGRLGEYVSSTVAVGDAVALTTTVGANVTNRSFTPGDWDVWGNGAFTGNGATTVAYLRVSLSTTSATPNATPGFASQDIQNGATPFASGNVFLGCAGPAQFSFATTTTVYLVADAGFATSTCSAFGVISARRAR